MGKLGFEIEALRGTTNVLPVSRVGIKLVLDTPKGLHTEAATPSGAWHGQWSAVQSLQADIFSNTLPKALELISSLMSEEDVLHAVKLMSTLDSTSAAGMEKIQNAIVQLDTAAEEL